MFLTGLWLALLSRLCSGIISTQVCHYLSHSVPHPVIPHQTSCSSPWCLSSPHTCPPEVHSLYPPQNLPLFSSYLALLRGKLGMVCSDSSHPLHGQLRSHLIPRGSGRLGLPYAGTNRHPASFLPQAIKLYNGNVGR